MKYFSTFTGIGAIELALSRIFTNAECVGYSEIDKYAINIYERHFPSHKNYGDITRIDADSLPDFDAFFGGFPCQSFSIAGKRRGFEDTRGTLFFDVARILRAKKPRLFLLENVKGLLSHDNGRTFKVIVSTLTELGYDLQWQVLNSKDFGVPQNRERIFIIGHLRGEPRPQVFPLFGDNREAVFGALTNSYHKGQHSGSYVEEARIGTLRSHKDDKGFREMKSGLSRALRARARNDGDGQPVIIARNQRGETREMDISGSLTKSRSAKQFSYLKVPEATKKGYAIAEEGDSINLAVMSPKTRRGRVGKGIAQTIDCGMNQHTLDGSRVRRLTPMECERLQGFPDGWTGGVSDTQRYKCLGNAITVNTVEAVLRRLFMYDKKD